MITVEPFRARMQDGWNELVRSSRNGTFLFERDYMDYHRDRFEDASLVFRGKERDARALLPACIDGDHVWSHAGLTYGGLVLGQTVRTVETLEILKAAIDHYASLGARSLTYKCVPYIYHRLASGDDLYALFRLGATLVRRDVSSTVQPASRPAPQARRLRGARRAASQGVSICESQDFASFWTILEENLESRHGERPVHSLDEITLLAGRFPDSIRLFVAVEDSLVVAGTVIYETDHVAHAQYIGSSGRGREVAALDLLFEELIGRVYGEKRYFDFGISTVENGNELNAGLIEYKEGFGATATVYDFYRVDFDAQQGRVHGS